MDKFGKLKQKQKADAKRIDQLMKSVEILTKSHKRRYELDSDNDENANINDNNENSNNDGNARKRRKLNRIHRLRHNRDIPQRQHQRSNNNNNDDNNNNDPNENKQDNNNNGSQENQNNNIYNNNDNNNSASFDRLGLGLEKDAITEVYRFKSTYDGTLGEPALLFRQAVVDYEERVDFRLGDRYDEERLVGRIHDALTDKAKQKLRTDEARRQYTVTEFLKWFDKAFKLYKLRKQLYYQLTNWTIGPNDSELQLVDDYQAKYNLFKETTTISTAATIASTKLSREMRINCLNRAIELAKPNLHKQITHWIQNQHRQPKSLDELNIIIEDSVSTLEAIAANSNTRNKDPTDLGIEGKDNLTNQNKDTQNNDNSNNVLNTTSYNGYNYPRSNYRGNRGRGRGRVRGRGGYRGGYRGRGSRSRGNSRGGYRGRGNRSRGRGYRGYRRGGRGRYYDSSKNTNVEKSKDKDNTQSDDEIPLYNKGDCYNCNEWGHIAEDCDRIHTRKYNRLRQQYISFKSSHGSVNNINQSKKKSKQKSKSYNTNYSDSDYDDERDY